MPSKSKSEVFLLCCFKRRLGVLHDTFYIALRDAFGNEINPQNIIAVLDTKMSVQTINRNRNFVYRGSYPVIQKKCSDFHVGDIDASNARVPIIDEHKDTENLNL